MPRRPRAYKMYKSHTQPSTHRNDVRSSHLYSRVRAINIVYTRLCSHCGFGNAEQPPVFEIRTHDAIDVQDIRLDF